MEPVKIRLTDAAKNRECSVDYLLALAAAGRIDIFARIGPYSAVFKDRRGKLMPIADVRGGAVPVMGVFKMGGFSFTTLLPYEAAMLGAGQLVTVCFVREEGAENGVRFPYLGDEEYLRELTEPQTIGIDQVFTNGHRT